MNTLLVTCAVVLIVPAAGLAYEKAFEETKPGTIEIKEIPERTLIVARRGESYFDENNAMFGQLFRYIKANDVSMTVPVKADINPGKMYFYVGTQDLTKDLRNSESVEVVVEPARMVMSLGVRGGYSEKNFEQARKNLFDQLQASKDWKQSGEAYAIFWNGPYVPAFMKKFEVHVPVVPAEQTKEE
ncbi:heme-binding protein [Pontiellaceae bacterium B1224]|nr:heme-binding protein [Pontiellaceae bacterium B1224]